MIKTFLMLCKNYIFAKKNFRFVIKNWTPLFKEAHKAANVINCLVSQQGVIPDNIGAPKGDLLVIAPHPDDEVIGCGGTLLQSRQKGARITILFLTSGYKDMHDIREKESISVAKELDAETIFLRHEPLKEYSQKTEDQIIDVILSNTNRGLFLPFFLDDHKDHQMVSKALIKAYRNGHIPGDIPVWAYQVYTSILPNTVIDITNVAQKKRECIGLYTSQYQSRDWGHYSLGLNAYNSRFLKTRNDEAYAEIFLQLPLKGYVEFAEIYFETP